MHWFWRAAIAVAATHAFYAGYRTLVNSVLAPLLARLQTAGFGPVLSFVLLTPVLGFAVAVYGVLTARDYRTKFYDGETRCRRCEYILKGLTEPRCPECGEAI